MMRTIKAFMPDCRGRASVSILLFIAGLVLGVGASLATGVLTPPPSGAGSAKAKPADGAKGQEPLIAAASEEELKAMITELQELQARMEEDRKNLTLQERTIAQEKSTLEKMKKEIETVEARLTKFVHAKSESEAKNVKRLAKQWAMMQPAEVYEIAKGLDEVTAARILYAMNDRKAAPILATFATQGPEGTRLARTITERLRDFAQVEPPSKNTQTGGKRP